MASRAIISLSESDYWHSCQLASLGLRSAYSKAFPRHCEEFFLSKFSDNASVNKIAQEIINKKYSSVVFIDSSPLYGRLLSMLHSGGYSGAYRFHVFGDVVRRSAEWLKYCSYLVDRQVEWVCASVRQKQLVGSLLSSNHTWVCPFPVLHNNFLFSKRLRIKKRSDLKIGKNEFVILYTGRMTLQKNVLALVQAFKELPLDVIKKSRLVFVGDFDDLAPPFVGMKINSGAFYRMWEKALSDLSPLVRRKIQVLPGCSAKELRAIYSAADLFCSLSLQHDEDFGMAPVEAAISGLPLVLTSWGGYANFQAAKDRVKMVPVSLAKEGPCFSLSVVTESIADFILAKSSRSAKSLAETKNFEVAAVSRLLRERESLSATNTVFEGFDKKMDQLRELFVPEANLVVFSDTGENSIYEQVYRNYCDEK